MLNARVGNEQAVKFFNIFNKIKLKLTVTGSQLSLIELCKNILYKSVAFQLLTMYL